MKTVKLTAQQAAQVEWALGAMVDYWCDESEADARDGDVVDEAMLPTLHGDGLAMTLTLSPLDDVNDDLLYRLEEQLQDMARQAQGSGWDSSNEQIAGDAKAGRNAAKLIRKAIAAN